MKRAASVIVFLLLLLLLCIPVMGWEPAVHAKGVQDVCKALGFTEDQAAIVGDGAWVDGNDIRVERKAGQKSIQLYRNQDRAFNTGVMGDGIPVKTYGKIAISPNDTRYLNSQKYLNKAIRLANEGKSDEAFYALGVGVRSLQNIFANRDVVKDSAWLAQGKMENGAATWVPGAVFSTAWHNVNPDDDVFSNEKTDALKASLEATADYIGEFLTACPQAIANAKQLSATAVDDIAEETLALLQLKEELSKNVQQIGRVIIDKLNDAVAAFPLPKTAEEEQTLPPSSLTVVPARWLATQAKLTFKQQLDDVKSDVDDFSGSAATEWKEFAKATGEKLDALRKSADDITKSLVDAATALKKASSEEAYEIARKQLYEMSTTVFMQLKPHWRLAEFFDEQVAYWIDVLNGQMSEFAVQQNLALWKNYHAMKSQLPKAENAFADFISNSNATVKEYTSRCENALADFEQEMAAIAESYGQDAAALKKSAAECVSAARAVFDEKAKQATESLKGIAPLKQGDEIPKAVDDVIRRLMKDASELKDNVLKNVSPSASNSSQPTFDLLLRHRFLEANAVREDFLWPIDIGSTRPDSWKPAVWTSDDELEITLTKRFRITYKDVKRFKKFWDNGKKANDTAKDILKVKEYGDRISEDGFTTDVAQDMMGDLGGKVIGDATSPLFEMGGKVIGKAIGGRFGPIGSKIGGVLGEIAGGLVNDLVGDWVGEHLGEGIDYVFGIGTSEAISSVIVDGVTFVNDTLDAVDDFIIDTVTDGVDYISDQWDKFWNSEDEIDPSLLTPDFVNSVVDEIDNIMNVFQDTFNLNDPIQRTIAMDWLNFQLGGITSMVSGFMDMFSSIAMQMRGFMMNIMNLAVNIQHIDVSAEMNQSLQVLTNDLNVMGGKDDEQDKSVVRKATIENKGRDLKRQSNKGGDLKGAPSVQQVKMGGGEQGGDNVGRDRIGPGGNNGDGKQGGGFTDWLQKHNR